MLLESENQIFIKKEIDKICNSPIRPPSMYKKQPPQMIEPCKGVISCKSGLVALFSKNTNSNMGNLDHTHIVTTITNSQSSLLKIVPDKRDDLSLLVGG